VFRIESRFAVEAMFVVFGNTGGLIKGVAEGPGMDDGNGAAEPGYDR
jgi:hypothetical protein